MNTYNVNDENFKKSNIFNAFMKENPSLGKLRIRAYAANEAIPISDLKVIISTDYNDSKIIFYEGLTDESGVIEKVSLPVPKINSDNLISPNRRVYEIHANYKNLDKLYKVNMFEDICVVQDIVVTPNINIKAEY